jgi:hypothetical protein
MMGMIAGMGMGNVVGGAIGGAAQQASNPSAPPPIPQAVQWFAAINGQQAGPFDSGTLQTMIQQNKITKQTLIWRQGMPNWQAAIEVPEVAGAFNQAPPPIPPPIP